MKRAIVTGANGFVGHYLTRELLNSGYNVIAVIRNEEENISNICGKREPKIVYCDLKEMDLLNEKIGKYEDSIFFHLAWAGSSGAAREDYALQLDNAKATARAAESAVKIGCSKFIVAGSVTQLMYRDYLQLDKITPEMITCYAIGKITAESLCKCVCGKSDLKYCWAYIANFYGEDDPTQNFINLLVDSYLNNHMIALTDGEQLADFIHVSDVAGALIALGEKGQDKISYYLGYGAPRMLQEYVHIIYNKIAPIVASGIGEKKLQGLSINYDTIDYMRLNRDTGFKPRISFEDGLDKVIEKRKMLIENNKEGFKMWYD